MIGKSGEMRGGLDGRMGRFACFTKAQANDRSMHAQGESSLQQGLQDTGGPRGHSRCAQGAESCTQENDVGRSMFHPHGFKVYTE